MLRTFAALLALATPALAAPTTAPVPPSVIIAQTEARHAEYLELKATANRLHDEVKRLSLEEEALDKTPLSDDEITDELQAYEVWAAEVRAIEATLTAMRIPDGPDRANAANAEQKRLDDLKNTLNRAKEKSRAFRGEWDETDPAFTKAIERVLKDPQPPARRTQPFSEDYGTTLTIVWRNERGESVARAKITLTPSANPRGPATPIRQGIQRVATRPGTVRVQAGNFHVAYEPSAKPPPDPNALLVELESAVDLDALANFNTAPGSLADRFLIRRTRVLKAIDELDRQARLEVTVSEAKLKALSTPGEHRLRKIRQAQFKLASESRILQRSVEVLALRRKALKDHNTPEKWNAALAATRKELASAKTAPEAAMNDERAFIYAKFIELDKVETGNTLALRFLGSLTPAFKPPAGPFQGLLMSESRDAFSVHREYRRPGTDEIIAKALIALDSPLLKEQAEYEQLRQLNLDPEKSLLARTGKFVLAIESNANPTLAESQAIIEQTFDLKFLESISR